MVLLKGKTLTHQVCEINVDALTPISVVKQKFSEVLITKLNMYDYKIIHLGRVLDDDDVITDDHDSKLFIIMTTLKKTEDIKKENISENVTKYVFKENNIVAPPPTMNVTNLPTSPPSLATLTLLTSFLGTNINPNSGEMVITTNLVLPDEENDEEIEDDKYNSDIKEIKEDDDFDTESESDGDDDDDDIPNLDETNEVVPKVDDNPNNENNSFNKSLVGNFSQSDVDIINEIVEMGFDYYDVIQMFTASGKDKETTVDLLFG